MLGQEKRATGVAWWDEADGRWTWGLITFRAPQWGWNRRPDVAQGRVRVTAVRLLPYCIIDDRRCSRSRSCLSTTARKFLPDHPGNDSDATAPLGLCASVKLAHPRLISSIWFKRGSTLNRAASCLSFNPVKLPVRRDRRKHASRFSLKRIARVSCNYACQSMYAAETA